MLYPSHEALIVVDVQNDFCPGGALGVPEGDTIIPKINEMIPLFPTVVYTQDWHPRNHMSFSENPAFEDESWPPHCVADTPGAQLHKDLIRRDDALYIHKGTEPDREAYSAFSGTELDSLLRERDVTTIYIAGLATDYCVKNSALDARKLGFKVRVVLDACRGIDRAGVEETIELLQQHRIVFTATEEITNPLESVR